MRRYEIAELTDDDLRRLRMLIKLNRAEAHIIVKCDYPWPIPIRTSARQWLEPALGNAIH